MQIQTREGKLMHKSRHTIFSSHDKAFRLSTADNHFSFVLVLFLFLGLFLLAAIFTGCDFVTFWNRRSHLTDLVADIIPPDFSYIRKILLPLFYTIQMSVTGTVLGSFFALLIAPFGAENLDFPVLPRQILRILIQILRSFPALILALISTFLFGLGTFAGTFAITLYTFAIMGKLTYEDIQAASPKTYQALRVMGTSRFTACTHAIFPEIAPGFFTNALYLLETNVRHSSILGYVGAGGIGLILNEKISWLEFDKVGAILLMLFLTVCMIEYFSRYLVALIRKEKNIKKGHARLLILLLAAIFLICTVTLSPPDLSRTSPQTLRNMLLGFLHPDMRFFFSTGKDGLFYLLAETICIAFVGTVIGAVVSLPLAFLNTRRFVPAPVSFLFNLLIMGIRSIPFLVYGLIFIRVSGPGAFTGVLTLAVCSIGLLTKRFTESLDALDMRPYHALLAMGVRPLPAICHSVLPQLKPVFTSIILYRFDVNIREASILGLVGAGGIGAPLIFSMNQYAWEKAGAIILGLILLVWLIDVISGKIGKQYFAS